MRNLAYVEFLKLVAVAQGPFGYWFAGFQFICDPRVYIPRHWRNGLPTARLEATQ